VVIVLCALGIASAAGMFKGLKNHPGAEAGQFLHPLPESAAKAGGCNSCGTIVLIRTFELHEELAEQSAFPLTSAQSAQSGARKRFVYRVTVQMDDGSFRTFSQGTTPAFGVGAKVRVLNGALAGRT
jgi:hypothetical protein